MVKLISNIKNIFLFFLDKLRNKRKMKNFFKDDLPNIDEVNIESPDIGIIITKIIHPFFLFFFVYFVIFLCVLWWVVLFGQSLRKIAKQKKYPKNKQTNLRPCENRSTSSYARNNKRLGKSIKHPINQKISIHSQSWKREITAKSR